MKCPSPNCKDGSVVGIVYRDKKGKPMMASAKCLKCGELYGAEVDKREKAIPAKDKLVGVQIAA